MKVKLIYLATIVVASLQSFAQNSLKIGQQLPDLEINKILYHKSQKAKLSDFKGKLIILDFWSTSCGPCIEGMSKMDSLQTHFGNKIAILPIYPDMGGGMDSKSVNFLDSFWRSNPILSKTSLPSILDDGFARYFPARVAYQVWIDGNRVVRAITSPEYVNEKEIQKMIDGIYPDWETEIYTYYDEKKPIFKETSSHLTAKSQFHSEFSGYRGRISGHSGIIDEKGMKRFYALNLPILSIFYSGIYVRTGKVTNSNIIVETRDSSRFFPNTYLNEWRRKNSYTYEAVYPSNENIEKVREKMQADLNQRLNIHTRFEKRLMDCWVLKKNYKLGKHKYDGKGIGYTNITELVRDLQSLVNSNANGDMYNSRTVINETGITNKLDIKLQSSLKIPQIIEQLKMQGIDMLKGKRLIEVFVISDNSKPSK